jgi:hypothetical protein
MPLFLQKKEMKQFLLLLCLLCSLAAGAQENIDTAALARIRAEEMMRSHIPEIAHDLLEVPGPRLTNSPGYKRAGEWVISVRALRRGERLGRVGNWSIPISV